MGEVRSGWVIEIDLIEMRIDRDIITKIFIVQMKGKLIIVRCK